MQNKFIKGNLQAIPFLLPFFIVYLLFTVFPMIKGLQMSLYEWTLLRKMDFVGLENYKRMILDIEFWESLWNTTFFVILATPSMVILALILALLANQNSKFKTFFRGSYFLPHVLSVAVISYIAIFMLQPYIGFLNSLLHSIGITAEPFWLADANLAWLSIVGVSVWWHVGFNMILYLAALQDIPDFLYEAGEIDGATKWQLFWHVTIPLIGPITALIVLLQMINSYKVFAQIWLITGGGPGTETRPIIQYIYEMGFKQNDLGYAATMSYGLFFILIILSFVQLKSRSRKGGV